MIGTTLGGYRIVEQVGTGGMATVYKAYDASTDRYVALKVLPAHYSEDPKFRERFEREAKAIAKLEHLHILPVHGYGEEQGVAYLVMRYLEAGTLADVTDDADWYVNYLIEWLEVVGPLEGSAHVAYIEFTEDNVTVILR